MRKKCPGGKYLSTLIAIGLFALLDLRFHFWSEFFVTSFFARTQSTSFANYSPPPFYLPSASASQNPGVCMCSFFPSFLIFRVHTLLQTKLPLIEFRLR